jgi:hypothetical protein
MRNTCFFIALALLLVHISCKEKDKSIYENCCGAAAMVDTVHMVLTWTDDQGGTFDTTVVGKIYIPNIFTPSADQNVENRIFMPFGNEWVKRIVYSKYFSDSGELLFSKENFQVNDTYYAWLGQQADGSLYKGGFNYEISAEYDNGQINTYTGRACAYQCSEIGFPKAQLPDCLFPSQNDGYGSPDITRPQPLECF